MMVGKVSDVRNNHLRKQDCTISYPSQEVRAPIDVIGQRCLLTWVTSESKVEDGKSATRIKSD